MKKLILATSNPGKIKELQEMLDGHYSVISQLDMAIEEVPENGLSFVENALIKARNASQKSGLAAIADDSGIVVNALNGEPGIYSARYAGKGATDSENVTKLLTEMDNVSAEDRKASFWCAIVLVRYPDDPTPLIIQSSWEGEIALEVRGKNGFGYDPVFYLSELRRTSAELSPKEKNLISHRGQALRELLRQLSFED